MKENQRQREAKKKLLLAKIEERKRHKRHFSRTPTQGRMRLFMFLFAIAGGYVGLTYVSAPSSSPLAPIPIQEKQQALLIDLMERAIAARRFQEAQQMGEDLYKEVPSPQLAYTLGELYQVLGKPKKALHYFTIAVKAGFRASDAKEHMKEIKGV